MEMMPQILSDRYQIICALGAGGFGETFLAEDIKMPSRRRCVIKRLKPIADNPEIYQLVKERFQREAAILEELGDGCSQIPKLYGYFEEGENFYLVQEWIDGVTLNTHLQNQGILSENSVQEILSSLLPVLDFVHGKKIVHRDIKPENVILRTSNQQPVLIDFGAVKETMGTTISSHGNTTSSIVISTPGFTPAEQGCGRPVYASDLYSLGLTMIYLLTGKLPQELENDPLTGRIIWRTHALQISPTLAGVLDKAIHPTAGDRYATAREMLESLKTNSDTTTPASGISATVISAPLNPTKVLVNPNTFPTNSVSSQPITTMVSSAGNHHSTAPINHGINSWYKAVITGSLVGGFILAALFILKPNNQQTISNEPTKTIGTTASSNPSTTSEKPSQSKEASPLQTQPPTVTSTPKTEVQIPSPVAMIPASPIVTPSFVPILSQVSSIGWVRIGAVNSTNSSFSYGESLIPTTQPVTIYPPVVPSIGSLVTVVTGLNLRQTLPQPPNYKLANKVGEIFPNQKLIILNIRSFVDSNSASPYTVVWAEVGLPQ